MYNVQIGSEWIGFVATVYEIEDVLRARRIKESVIGSVVVACWAVYDSDEEQVAYCSNGIYIDWDP